MDTNIKLGSRVRDVVSGFEGVCISRIEYITGCVQFGIQPESKDGKIPDPSYIDDKRLKVTGRAVKIPSVETGGDMRDAPRH